MHKTTDVSLIIRFNIRSAMANAFKSEWPDKYKRDAENVSRHLQIIFLKRKLNMIEIL